jgi:hypothetical protein
MKHNNEWVISGGLTFPPPRNNYGNTNPMNFSKLGPSDEYKDGWSCAGNECLWFSEGCYAGCPECSGEMPDAGNYFGKPNCDNPLEPTLPDKYMTWNIGKNNSDKVHRYTGTVHRCRYTGTGTQVRVQVQVHRYSTQVQRYSYCGYT